MSYTDFETKKTFVKQLGRLISAMYPQIAALEYHQHESDEVVIIRHQDGYIRRVDVTGDDLPDTFENVVACVRRRDCDA
ncbi:hypothetical protein [uncultured Dysosmobacter sp.]|uniref:hypothetical protein n=1 Tax=uncultured Dysosmobacter sp. TaxID=2591384 RepID=UPI00267194FA|nr:hypothetical protein [uncultured Dysosmobacter sp.]